MDAGTPASRYQGDVFGLATACINQGVAAYIAPLWPVQDVLAADLAAEFYRELVLHRASVGEALRRAKVRARGGKSGGEARQLTWASFVLYGDPTQQLLRSLWSGSAQPSQADTGPARLSDLGRAGPGTGGGPGDAEPAERRDARRARSPGGRGGSAVGREERCALLAGRLGRRGAPARDRGQALRGGGRGRPRPPGRPSRRGHLGRGGRHREETEPDHRLGPTVRPGHRCRAASPPDRPRRQGHAARTAAVVVAPGRRAAGPDGSSPALHPRHVQPDQRTGGRLLAGLPGLGQSHLPRRPRFRPLDVVAHPRGQRQAPLEPPRSRPARRASPGHHHPQPGRPGGPRLRGAAGPRRGGPPRDLRRHAQCGHQSGQPEELGRGGGHPHQSCPHQRPVRQAERPLGAPPHHQGRGSHPRPPGAEPQRRGARRLPRSHPAGRRHCPRE